MNLVTRSGRSLISLASSRRSAGIGILVTRESLAWAGKVARRRGTGGAEGGSSEDGGGVEEEGGDVKPETGEGDF